MQQGNESRLSRAIDSGIPPGSFQVPRQQNILKIDRVRSSVHGCYSYCLEVRHVNLDYISLEA